MFDHFFENSETRRIFIYLGAAGAVALVGGGVYAAAISAVTPTRTPTQAIERTSALPTAASVPIEQGPSVVLKGQTIRVSVADTPATRERGLSGRTALAKNEGMLFVFETEGQYGIWMKDMRFAIDILWIAADGTVVYLVESATPESYPEAFVSPVPARYVLELPADWVRSHRVSIGDKVEM